MNEVVVVRWPHDAARIDDLRGNGTARLLLVEPSAPPPEIADPLEDWVRMPASEEDVRARIRGLSGCQAGGTSPGSRGLIMRVNRCTEAVPSAMA